MLNEEFKEQIYFEDYKKNILSTNCQTESKIFKITDESFKDPIYEKSENKFFFISIIFNFSYFLHQIIFFIKKKPETVSEFYVTITIFSLYLILQTTFLTLKYKFRNNPSSWKFINFLKNLNSNIKTSFCYFTIYLHILTISLISFFSTRDKSKESEIYLNHFYYEFFLIVLSCLIFRTNAYNFLSNKIFRIFFIIFTLALILFISVIKRDFLILINSLTVCVLLFLICFLFNQREIFLTNKCREITTDTHKIFNHFHSTTKALNVAIFLFRNEELFFSNEIGNNILETFCFLPFKKFTQDSLFLNDNQTEIKQNTEYADCKVNITDSKIILNHQNIKRNFSYKSNNSVKEKNEIRLIFKNIFMYEDSLNISEIIGKCRINKVNREEFKESLEKNKLNKKNQCLTNLNNLKLNFNSDKRRNLYSIFRFLTRSSSHSENNSNCDCLSNLRGFKKLGIFEFQPRDKKIFYEIILKLDNQNNQKENNFLEFIFKDVTSNFDLLKQVEDNETTFKKNAHELKTPILSMLGCGEDLKSYLNKIENILPDSEKNKIKNYLEHMTNLSSFIGYLIRGLTNKDYIQLSTNKFQKIHLNSLLKFCFDVLQTLISCDEQKTKNVKTELKNLLLNEDVYFKSDEIQVKQILLNFISNSVKFTNYGKITLSTKIKKKMGNHILKIKIKDTGCGVKKEDSSKLFFQYSKLNKTESNEFGTGLGLNICKTIAKNLNMKIKFNSEENKGTKVTLYVFNPKSNQPRSIVHFKSNKTAGSNIENNNMMQFGTGVHQRSSSHQNLRFTTNKLINEDEEDESKLEQGNKSISKFEDFVNSKIERKKSRTMKLNKSGSLRLVDDSQNILDEVEEGEGENYSKAIDEDIYKKDTLVNPIMADLNYSQLSFSSSQSSGTFDMNPFKKNIDIPTRRENKNYTFGLGRYDLNSKNIQPSGSVNDCNRKISTNNPDLEKQSIIALNYHSKLANTQSSLLNNTAVPKKLIINSNIITNNSSRIIKTTQNKKSLFQEKVIVVDDQAPSRRALVNLIKNYFKEKDIVFDIVEGCDGVDCLNTVIKYPSRVRYIFIDENMTFMNGTEAAEIIRKYCENGKIGKVNLILTSAEDNIKYRKDLFDFCVTKPLTKENIQDIFEQA